MTRTPAISRQIASVSRMTEKVKIVRPHNSLFAEMSALGSAIVLEIPILLCG